SGEFTLVNAHSVFTHIYEHQSHYYLREVERILAPNGIARTTWFLFDREGYPWLEPSQNCLFVNSEDPTNAVIYDRVWFLRAVRAAGLSIRQTIHPPVPGHQWQIFLQKWQDGAVDNFPEASVAAEWLCGASPLLRDRNLPEMHRLKAANQDLECQVT